MRSQLLLAIVLLLLATSSGFANTLSEREQRSRLQALRTNEIRNLHPTLIERAYLDAYGILRGDNRCSRFFRSGAYRVLDELVLKLRIRTVTNTRIALQMSGGFISLVEPEERIAYRLFASADINSLGAFYKSKRFAAEAFVPNIGSFQPNTREARVLILLHELAHLIKAEDGKWLLPDDGSDAQLSRSNTLLVESKCEQQIRGL